MSRDLLQEALISCSNSNKNRWTDFTSNYQRPFLHPKDEFMTWVLFCGANEQVKGACHERDELYEEYKKGKVVKPALLEKAHNLEGENEMLKANEMKNDLLLEANAIYYEGYFWSGKTKLPVSTDRQEQAKSGYYRTMPAVIIHENNTLEQLQQKRDALCKKLPTIDWKNAINKAYCKLIQSAMIVSRENITLDKVYEYLTEKFLSRKPVDEQRNAVRDLARGNAFIIANVDKGTEINIEFVKTINAMVKPYDEPLKQNFMRHEKRLNSLINWLKEHKQKRDVDPITLAAIAHYGIFMLQSFMDGNHRTAWLLQNFILMDSGYPPLLIDDVNYNKYEQVKEETRKWGGLDIRPFIRCIYGCMEDTIRFLACDSPVNPEPADGPPMDLNQSADGTIASVVSCARSGSSGGKQYSPLTCTSSLDPIERILADSFGSASIGSASIGSGKGRALLKSDDGGSISSQTSSAEDKHVAHNREAIRPGWSYLMRTALTELNPQLLEY